MFVVQESIIFSELKCMDSGSFTFLFFTKSVYAFHSLLKINLLQLKNNPIVTLLSDGADNLTPFGIFLAISCRLTLFIRFFSLVVDVLSFKKRFKHVFDALPLLVFPGATTGTAKSNSSSGYGKPVNESNIWVSVRSVILSVSSSSEFSFSSDFCIVVSFGASRSIGKGLMNICLFPVNLFFSIDFLFFLSFLSFFFARFNLDSFSSSFSSFSECLLFVLISRFLSSSLTLSLSSFFSLSCNSIFFSRSI
ncbi:hypothetical protein AGLY_014304 [Aphis glycines]|uniref:Uncharacterized protein n=1 Tax=Aphis glycines TaxID=307491 RepID=A0A6G0T3M0_APHGL|nr:hypothetical protein AGLY_014304 [Aphis glycines]